jgi:hypothetical protein
MPDYGHQLAFGAFLTRQNQSPAQVAALTRLTERAGLDLVRHTQLRVRRSQCNFPGSTWLTSCGGQA